MLQFAQDWSAINIFEQSFVVFRLIGEPSVINKDVYDRLRHLGLSTMQIGGMAIVLDVLPILLGSGVATAEVEY